MRAMVLHEQTEAERSPLKLEDVAVPVPGAGQVRVRVRVCGVCRTDVHIVEGDVRPPRLPIIPGHQVVGVVDALGSGVSSHREGDRVGVPWLYSTDGTCAYCRRGLENLCDNGRFTGFDVNGGYAEALIVPSESAYSIPGIFSDEAAAPLLCAGVIGYRSYRLSGAKSGDRIVMIGFGSSAHLVLQMALHEKCQVDVITRSTGHQKLARELGANWVGNADDYPAGASDCAIVFAPAGQLVPVALEAVRKGGTVTLAGITMSEIPTMPYSILYHERVVRSVANSTHKDVREFLDLAAEVPIKASVQLFSLEQANEAILAVKQSKTEAAAVLKL
jgi:propanol-preferring alcohol dehydrogenase